MPAFQSLTVNDRAGTPVAHAFLPREEVKGVYKVSEAAAITAGDKAFTVSTSKLSTKRKTRVKFVFPVVVTETINGVAVSSVSRSNYVDAVFTMDDASTLQERNDTVGLFANALGAGVVLIHSTIVGGEGIW